MNSVSPVIGSRQTETPQVSRRNFLRAAGAGVAGLATGVLPGLHKAEADDRIKVDPDKLTVDFKPKDEKYETRLQEIIDNATKAGALKDENDFTRTVSVNRETGETQTALDQDAYSEYVEGLKARARVFDDVNDFGSLLSMVYKFKGNLSTPKLVDDFTAEKFIDHNDYRQSLNALGRINTGLLKKLDVNYIRSRVPDIVYSEMGLRVPVLLADSNSNKVIMLNK